MLERALANLLLALITSISRAVAAHKLGQRAALRLFAKRRENPAPRKSNMRHLCSLQHNPGPEKHRPLNHAGVFFVKS